MTCCYTNFSNSFNHRFGTRSYDGSLSATDNKFMNIFSLGDGSHNFHHTFQQDYRGHEKGHLNFYTTIIDVAEKLGWVYDLKSTSPEIIAKRMKRTGDESRVYQSKDNSKAEWTAVLTNAEILWYQLQMAINGFLLILEQVYDSNSCKFLIKSRKYCSIVHLQIFFNRFSNFIVLLLRMKQSII